MNRKRRGGNKTTAKSINSPISDIGIPNTSRITHSKKIYLINKSIKELIEKSFYLGTFPVDLKAQTLHTLKENYQVSWKADGLRMIMFIDGESRVYFLMNRAIFQAHKMNFGKNHNNSVFDGELITNITDGVENKEYLVFDAMVINKVNVCSMPFTTRYQKILSDLVEPLEKARGLSSLKVTRKEFWPCTRQNVTYLLSDEFKKSLNHKSDGLIFQPADKGYVFGQAKHTFKWKPRQLNSIDFEAKIVHKEDGSLECELHVCSSVEPFSVITKVTPTLAALHGKIIECSYSVTGEFELLRERTDRNCPNSLKTAKSIWECIENPVTEENLLDALS